MEYEDALKRDPKVEGVRYWLGYCYKRRGLYATASLILEQACTEDSSDPRPCYLLARITAGVDRESAAKRPAVALAYAKEAVQRDGGKSAFYLAFVAECQFLEGKKSAGTKTMRRAISLADKEDRDYYVELLASFKKKR